MPNKPPAFQFYVKDWLSSEKVRAMSLAGRGVFIDLLAYAWQSQPGGTLPDDTQRLRRLVGAERDQWENIWPEVSPCFEVDGDYLVNRRMQHDAAALEMFRNGRSEAGRKGAIAKHGVRTGMAEPSIDCGSATVLPVAQGVANDGSASASASASSSSIKSKEGRKEGASASSDQTKTPAEPRTEIILREALVWVSEYEKPEDIPEEEQGLYLTRRLFECLGTPKHHLNKLPEWEADLSPLLHKFHFTELYHAIGWAIAEDPAWPKFIRRPKNIVDNAEKIVDGYRAHLRGKATYERSLKQVSTSLKDKPNKQAPSNYGSGIIELQEGEEL